jgi:hypothetical protein
VAFAVGKLDRFLGLDDDRERQERAPLWKRSVWHALKALVRKHPGAALSAAGSGVGYAVKQGVGEGAEAIKEKIDNVREALTPATSAPEKPIEEQAALPAPDAPVLTIDVDDPNPDVAHAADCVRELSDEEKKKFVESLAPEDRKALAEAVKK